MPHNKKVLIVDDEEFNRDILTDYLEDAGYEVIQATDGDVALMLLEDMKDIKILILDRMMPRMNGLDVLTTLKSNPAYKDLTIILQTAASSPEQIQEGLDKGAYYYLAKPFKEATLLNILHVISDKQDNKQDMFDQAKKRQDIFNLIETAKLEFQSREELQNFVFHSVSSFPQPEILLSSLHDVILHALETGQINHDHQGKEEILSDIEWERKIEDRLNQEENLRKSIKLTYDAVEKIVGIHLGEEKHSDPLTLTFPTLSYKGGKDNEIRCTLRI